MSELNKDLSAPRVYFSVDEANRQIEKLSAHFCTMTQLRAQLKVLYAKLEQAGCAPDKFGDDSEETVHDIPSSSARDYGVFRALLDTLRDCLSEVEELGCVVKDIEGGLCDFYAKHEGREILLCWRYGESEVSYWHELDAGFSGRRSVRDLVAPRPAMRI